MRERKLLGALGLTLLGLGLYRFRRQFVGRWLGLRAVRYKVAVHRDLIVGMEDGVNLVADHYAPRGQRLFPAILIRTPYGRSNAAGWSGVLPDFIAQRFAERGYNVIVQDVRGRFDSGGEFDPFVHEASDGRATLAWIERQPWFNGMLGMWGQSYLGYVQWALAPGAPLYLKALLPSISGSRLPTMARRDQAFSLDTLLRWLLLLDLMHRARGRLGFLRLASFSPRWLDRKLRRAAAHLPLGQADRKLVGREVPFFDEWLSSPNEADAYWRKRYPALPLGQVNAAAHLVGGWYDILLRETLHDYLELRTNGRQPYLTIGPWGHLDTECLWETLRQGIDWFDAHLKGDPSRLRRTPVRIYVMGADAWRDLESWPPPTQEACYFLHGGADEQASRAGALERQAPSQVGALSSYVYDPAKPTPAVGGALMSQHAGSHDNRSLESRPDVLTFTSQPLAHDLEIIGAPRLVLYAHSSLAHTDFFARVCDVYPDGRSMNVCDGLLRLEPGRDQAQPDGSLRLELDLWPTAYRFSTGHSIRLQISSGAHPRWNRNLGSGEPLASGTRMQIAQQMVYHDSDHPSTLILPVTGA